MRAIVFSTDSASGPQHQCESEIIFRKDRRNQELYIVNLYPQMSYQIFEGFGGAITEAVGTVLNQAAPEVSDQLLGDYFGPGGIGYRLIRTHLDSCDFSSGEYTAGKISSNGSFTDFSLSRDEKNIIPWIHKARELAGCQLSVMLTPWSPLSFMKTNKSRLKGGRLRPEFYRAWAEYICRYILEYQRRGIKIDKLSVQNEPNAVQIWESCLFSASEEKEFLRDYLAPEIEKAGLQDTELYIWDHNKERAFDRAEALIGEDTDRLIKGLAFHWYSGDHFDAINMIRAKYPDKKLVFSEGSIEYSRSGKGNPLQNAQRYAHDIIGNINAGMNCFIDWNIVLDTNGGPNHKGNFCESPVFYDTLSCDVVHNLSFYYIGHFSKFIKPGATRIGTTVYSSDLESSGFRNPDDSLTLVILNRTVKTFPIFLRLSEKIAGMSIGANSIHTIQIKDWR